MRQSIITDTLQALLVMWLNNRRARAAPDDVVREVGGTPLCDSHRFEAVKRAAARLGYDTPAEMLTDLANEVAAAQVAEECDELADTLRGLAERIGKEPLSSDLVRACEQLEEVASELRDALDVDDSERARAAKKTRPQPPQPAPGA